MGKMLRGFALKCSWHWLIGMVLLLSISCGAQGGQKQKKSNPSNQSQPLLPMPVSDQIDRDIGEMLAAFQLGNVEGMHKYYADNATFVSGVYEPLVIGWQNYAALYQRQRTAFQGMQLIRRNTFVYVHSDIAWASYQWEFDSMLNGQPYSVQGQTSLILNKVGDNWLIVHNHTSEICSDLASAPTQQLQQQVPEQNPPGSSPTRP